MTLLQAILLAMLYWLAAGEIFVPFTYCFCDLMLISLLTGVILGDPVKGCIVGGTIQPLYLALTAVRGAMPVDKEAAGIVTTAMVITAGISQGLMARSSLSGKTTGSTEIWSNPLSFKYKTSSQKSRLFLV